MKKQDIEQQIWEYLDGTCSAVDRQRIGRLISEDAQWKELYTELSALNTELGTALNIEEAPLLLSQKVISQIEQQPIIKKSPSALTWAIRAIAAFFIISIGLLLVDSLSNYDIGLGDTPSYTRRIDLHINQSTVNTLTACTGFALLIFLLASADLFLRRSIKHQ